MMADGSQPTSGDRLETVVMVVSALLIVGVTAYLASQALTTPTAPNPTATVGAVEPAPGAGEDIHVTVNLDNEGEIGLASVEVMVQCGSVERSLSFTHVPARGHRTGTVVCPAGTTPRASVATWVEA